MLGITAFLVNAPESESAPDFQRRLNSGALLRKAVHRKIFDPKDRTTNHFNRRMTMLVLTRRSEEKIIIGDENGDNEIEITVLKITRDKVSLGFKAKPTTRVYRKELLKGAKTSNSASDQIKEAAMEPAPINQVVQSMQVDIGRDIKDISCTEKGINSDQLLKPG